MEVGVNSGSCIPLNNDLIMKEDIKVKFVADFKNSIRVLLVNTMLVSSQSNIPLIIISFDVLERNCCYLTEAGGPFSLLGKIDSIGRGKSSSKISQSCNKTQPNLRGGHGCVECCESRCQAVVRAS